MVKDAAAKLSKNVLRMKERSTVPCEDLVYGRISFRGFNPEVEKLMLLMNTHKEEEDDEEDDVSRMETDITDEEMARRYESLFESMRKNFAKKKNRSSITKSEEDVNCNVADNQLKKVFLKPQD